MALPPNAFKDLLDGSNDEIYDTLFKKRCLSRRGRRNRDAVLELMENSARRFSEWVKENPGMTGPNQQDRLADALLGSPFVNATAKCLANNRSPWWKIW